MNRFSYAALSLIAAIPGAYLCFLLVMAMTNHFAEMAGMMRAVVCGILGLSVVVTVIPVGILIFVKDEEAEETKADDEGLEEAEDEVEELAAETPAAADVEAVAELPDLEAAGVDDAEASVMIEHSDDELEEVADDVYETDEEDK